MKIYLINYTIYGELDNIIKSGSIKVKNQKSETAAKTALKKFLKQKYTSFSRLIIHTCTEETIKVDKTLETLKNMFGMT